MVKSLTTFCLFAILALSTLGQANITALEYFVDEDPGVGNATPIAVSQGPTVNISVTFPTSGMGLENGFHFIGIRAMNSNGIWSHYERRIFYIQPDAGISPSSPEDIVELEYFFETDPGQEDATSISVAQGQSVNISEMLESNALPEGFFTVSIRAKNAAGIWGFYETRIFYIQDVSPVGAPPPADIVELEYYFDVDPGHGQANSISVAQGQIVDISEVLESSNLSDGYHNINIRAKNSNGIWGMTEKRTVYVQETGSVGSSTVLINRLEYYIDEDPGFGNGYDIPITGGVATVDLASQALSTQGPLTIGEHKIVIRGQGVNGAWGFPEFRTFDVDGDCPIANFTVNLACEDEQITISDASTGILGDADYIWYINGDSVSNIEGDINYVFENPGTHTISLVVQNGAVCQDSTGQTIQIKNKPVVFIDADDTKLGDTTIFEVDTFNVGSSYTWNWDFDSDNSVDSVLVGNIKYIYGDTGVYVAELRVADNSGCSATAKTSLTIFNEAQPTSGPSFSAFYDFEAGCVNTPTIFTNLTQNATDNTTYGWDFDGDGTIDDTTATSTSFTFNSSGTFATSLIAVEDGDTSTYTRSIVIATKPVADFSFGPGCPGDLITFENKSDSVVQASYSWDFNGDGIMDSEESGSPGYAYADEGDYTVTLLVENGTGCFDRAIKNISIGEAPSAQFVYNAALDGSNAKVLFENQSVGNSSSSWDFGDENTSSEKNPFHEFTNVAGQTFTVCLTVANNCADDTFCDDLSFAVSGTEELNSITVFPNPGPGYIQFDLSNLSKGDYSIKVYDLKGKIFRNITYTIEAKGLRLYTLNHLETGSYLLEIQGQRKSWKQVFFIE